MSTTKINSDLNLGIPVNARLDTTGLIRSFVSAVRQWNQGVQGRWALSRLNDRMIRDIGLTRSAIDDISKMPLWRDQRKQPLSRLRSRNRLRSD